MAWVYLLTCSDGSFYVGSTRDLDQRLEQHHTGRIGYTSTRTPITLVWSQEFDSIAEAWEGERRIHGWSRRKKQALVDGDIALLKRLASRAGRQSDASGAS